MGKGNTVTVNLETVSTEKWDVIRFCGEVKVQRQGKRKDLIIPLTAVAVSADSSPDAVCGHQYDATHWDFLPLAVPLVNLISK